MKTETNVEYGLTIGDLTLIQQSQFFIDLDVSLMVNSNDLGRGMYNLVVCKNQLSLYVKTGMKPNRHWKLKTLNAYFNLPGNASKLLIKLEGLYNHLTETSKK